MIQFGFSSRKLYKTSVVLLLLLLSQKISLSFVWDEVIKLVGRLLSICIALIKGVAYRTNRCNVTLVPKLYS